MLLYFVWSIESNRLRLEYQNDEVIIFEPDAKEIKSICDKIVDFDKVLTEFNRVIS